MRSVQWGRVDEAPEGVGGPETWGGVCRSATTDGCLALGSVSWRLLARLALPPPSAVAARSCTGGRPLHRLLHAAGLRVHHARGARRLRCQRRDEPAAAVVRCALPPTVPVAGRVLLLRGGAALARLRWAAPAAALGSGSLSRPSPLLPALLHVHRPCRSPIRAGLLEVFGATAIDQTLRGSGREAGDFGESAPLPPAPQQQARTGSSRLPLLALKRAATRLCAQASTRSA